MNRDNQIQEAEVTRKGIEWEIIIITIPKICLLNFRT